jgi:hypothetical protein
MLDLLLSSQYDGHYTAPGAQVDADRLRQRPNESAQMQTVLIDPISVAPLDDPDPTAQQHI